MTAAASATDHDRRRHDAAWASVVLREASALDMLAAATTGAAAAAAAAYPATVRQRVRPTHASALFGTDAATLAGPSGTSLRLSLSSIYTGDGNSLSESRPAASLDQLYSQAIATVPLLYDRCAGWAAEACGVLQLAPLAAAEDGDVLALWIRKGMLKHPRRAAVKALVRK